MTISTRHVRHLITNLTPIRRLQAIMWSNLNQSVESTGGGFLDDSRSRTLMDEKNQRARTVVPLMIKHLPNCTGDKGTVTIVGIVRHVDVAAIKTTFEIEDATGRVTAFRWMATEVCARQPQIEPNTYVRLYGFLREQSGKKYVLALRICPLTSLNELTNHLLEVICVGLRVKRMRESTVVGDLTRVVDSKNMYVDTADPDLLGLTKEQVVVFKLIQADNASPNGTNRSVLKSRVPKNILPQVDSIIDFLSSEGHVYSTTTDHHFKTT